MLTRRQYELLCFIERYLEATGGVGPSYDEMATGIGAPGKSSVARLVDGLEERGYIRRLPRRARAIEILPATRAVARQPRRIVSLGRRRTIMAEVCKYNCGLQYVPRAGQRHGCERHRFAA